MAHELATTNGRAAMMYAGEPPWHRLGTRLDSPPTAELAIEAAGLAYEVESLPVFAHKPDGDFLPIADRVLNVRKDDGAVLGLVSDKYRVVQNHEAFSFMDAVVGEGGMAYETAGALGKGERVWMLGKLPEHVQVRGKDRVDQYLLMYNSHDGTSALRIAYTPIRVVCANTVRAALRGIGESGATIRHTGDMASKVEEARRALDMASRYFKAFGEAADLLGGVQVSRDQLRAYFETLYPNPEGEDPGKAKSVRMTLTGLFEQGMGQDLPAIRGTAWAAYNAVTEYVDHHMGRNEAKRLESAWFGDGARAKARAWDAAIDMAEGRSPAVPAGLGIRLADPVAAGSN